MGAINTILNGSVETHTTLQSIGDALAAGAVPVRADGQPMLVYPFMGGVLLDWLPLNVYLFETWYEGQKEAMQPYWSNGSIPQPSAVAAALPVSPLPAEFSPDGESSLASLALPLAIGAALFLFSRRKA